MRSRKLRPNSSRQQVRKRKYLESPPPQSSKRSKKTNQSPLPQEIIVEIFLNLPVRSLLRFRCLSKFCKSLVANPSFIKNHLEKAQNDPKFTRKRVLLYASNAQKQIGFKSCSLNAIYKDPFINSVEAVDPSTIKGYSLNNGIVVGSCNGLICLHDIEDDNFFLLNPTLRVCKRLPRLRSQKRPFSFYRVYGFGYDASVDDYKVVRILCDFCSIDTTIVWVYSLRTNCWRRIQGFSFGYLSSEAGKYVDGSLNWMQYVGGSSWNIVSFDLAHETYKEVPQPCCGDADGGCVKWLEVLDGCLCVHCSYRLRIDVWVMREYGNTQSWTKLLTIPYLSGPGFQVFPSSKSLSVSDEILLHSGAKLILYNPKEKTLRIPMLDEDAVSSISRAEIYAESLVSPKVINHPTIEYY
ncbi:hypothetical protein CCACVL1_19540 [Corchorus capsularis]|uniref:F-box domain-containing protein n=1 Tax=Corchorus capsularis TaxID=210143 RepID=A0A1R3HGI9_COCAP|nr:hypothetical protein CCACVL1_19540 [Corchorus capsularis]